MAGIKERFNNIFSKFPVKISFGEKVVSASGHGDHSNFARQNIWVVPYDGEKNLGEIGPIKDYHMDYPALRARSWQSYIESEISQIVLNKFNL